MLLARLPKHYRFLSLQDILSVALERLKIWSAFTNVHAFLYSPLFLAIGIGGYFAMAYEPSSRLVFNLWIGSLVALLFAHNIYYKTHKFNILRFIGYAICLIVSGFFLAQYRTISVHAPMLEKELKCADIEGTIHSVDVLAEGQGQRIVLTNLKIEELTAEQTPYSVRLKVRGGGGYQPGQRVEVLAGLNPPSAPASPGAFDFQRQSYFKHLGAVGFSYRSPEIVEGGVTQNSGFYGFWEGLRLELTKRIQAALPLEQQGVIITFMTGEKSSIETEDLEAMRGSGLAHLLAISGLHVGLVAGFMFFFSRLAMAGFENFALKHPIKKYAAGIALLSAFIYMFLVGASVPTQRAMMMSGIALFAIMIDRSPFSLRMVAVAAIVIMVVYPEALISASFQMSFAAVTALVWFYDSFRLPIQQAYREAGFIKRGLLYIGGIALTTIIAGSATALYGVYHFQAWSAYSTLANVLAMPVMGTLVMPLAVVSYLLMPFGLEWAPLTLMGYGVEWVLIIAHYVSGLEGAVINFASFSNGSLAIATLACLLIMIGPTILRTIGAALLCLLMVSFLTYKPHAQIFIEERGDLIGIYEPEMENFALSSFRSNRYVRDNWTRMLGLEKGNLIKFDEYEDINCDAEGCRVTINNVHIAIPYTTYAQKEDCKWADIIITNIPVKSKCRGVEVIDYYFLKRNGASKIMFDESGYSIITNKQSRGIRPWTQ